MSFSERWHHFEQWGTKHPVLLGVGIFVVGAIVLWMFLPSRQQAEPNTIVAGPTQPSDAYYGYQASLADQGNKLQIAQIQAKTATDIAGIELTGLQTQVAGDVTMAQYGYQTQSHIAELQQTSDLAQIAATAQSQDLLSTLSAQVQQASFNRDVTIAGYNAAAATEVAQIGANRDLGITAYQAQVANSTIAAQLAGLLDSNASAVQMSQIAANSFLTGKTLDILGTGQALPHQLVTYNGPGGISGSVNINPPAIENIPYRELYQTASDPTAQGDIARAYFASQGL